MKRVIDAGAFAPERDEEGRALQSEAVFDRRWMLLVTLIVLFGLACAIDAFLPRHVRAAHAVPVAGQVASAPAETRDPRGSHIVTKCIAAGRITFSDQPCDDGARSEHIAVDPEQNVSDGLLPSQIGRSAAPPRAGLRGHQCDALAARIKAIEQQSGEAVAMGTQEGLAALRREYRDAQYRMEC